MHTTTVKTKKGQEYKGALWGFRPSFNYFGLLCGDETKQFSFDECESVITEGERLNVNTIGDCDEIKRAKKILDDGRKYKWTETDELGIRHLYPQEKFEWEKRYE